MSGKSGIPSWQRAQSAPSSAPAAEDESKPEQRTESPPTPGPEESTQDDTQSEVEGTSLLDTASKFLEDPSIRDAPREKKVAFLESKGVKSEEIETLLAAPVQKSNAEELPQDAEALWSAKPAQTSQPPAPKPQPRDVPPIVTYPEFLVQPDKPPPIITTQRLLTTAYVTGGLVATMYGLSKYIIAPMTHTLTESRHDFALHTKEKLDELNTKLEVSVSTDPALKPKPKIADIVDDVSEADSDPTELFHHDVGTQTTPTLSRRPSVSESTDSESVVASHESRLKILTSHLKELESTRSNDTAASDSLKTKLADLSTYLSEMSYQNQYYSGMGGLYGGTYGLPKTKDGKDDHIEALKTDIRAVKGVLLSARNFPAGGPRTTGRVGG